MHRELGIQLLFGERRLVQKMQSPSNQIKPQPDRHAAGKGRTAVAQARLILLVMINVAQLWILAATVEAALAHRFAALAAARCCLRTLLCRYADIDFLVAASFAPLHQFRLLKAMKDLIESLLMTIIPSLASRSSDSRLLTLVVSERPRINRLFLFSFLSLCDATRCAELRIGLVNSRTPAYKSSKTGH